MGSCFYSVGWQYMPMGPTACGYSAGGALSSSTCRARPGTRRAGSRSSRLAQEAKLAGADAVLGVEITRGAYDWAQGLIEFVAVGTAVVSDGYDFGEERLPLVALAGSSSRASCASGWMPVGIAAGSTVAYVVGGCQTMQALSGYGARWQNQELTRADRGPLRGAAARDAPRRAPGARARRSRDRRRADRAAASSRARSTSRATSAST